MKLNFLILFFGILFGLTLNAQENQEGNLKFVQDSRVDTLLVKYTEVNKVDPNIQGWRIEIFFEAGNYSKKQAMDAKSAFVQRFPEIPSYLIFQQPYYKVRVGDYRTKMDAEKFLRFIEPDYPNAFVVVGNINFPSLD